MFINIGYNSSNLNVAYLNLNRKQFKKVRLLIIANNLRNPDGFHFTDNTDKSAESGVI